MGTLFSAPTALQWTFTSPSQRTIIAQGVADAALALYQSQPASVWQQHYNISYSCSDSGAFGLFNTWFAPTQESTCNGWRYALPLMKSWGVSNTTLSGLVTVLNSIFNANFPGQIFTSHNFANDPNYTVSLVQPANGFAYNWYKSSNIQ
jgi:hypothetical protein